MADKCPSCGSCGMPLEKPEDFALGDVTRASTCSPRASRPTRRRAWRKPCWRTCLRGGAGTETNRTRGYPDRVPFGQTNVRQRRRRLS